MYLPLPQPSRCPWVPGRHGRQRPSPQIRGTLKSWTKLWCVLKPGVLLIYKTPKVGQWVGTVLLHCCELIERPSKKDGFCFKLFHPLDQSVWAVKVPQCEPWGSGGPGKERAPGGRWLCGRRAQTGSQEAHPGAPAARSPEMGGQFQGLSHSVARGSDVVTGGWGRSGPGGPMG